MSGSRPRRRIGIALIALGLLGVVACGIVAAVTGLRPLFSPSSPTPGVIERELEPGRYSLYELVGSSRRTGPVTVSNTGFPSLGPDNFEVRGPDGAPVEVRRLNVNEQLSRGSEIFVGVGSFRARTTGRYTVTVTGGEPGKVIVAPSLIDAFKSAVPWVGGAFVSALTALLGLILALTGRKAAPSSYASAPSWPPGWYPAPHHGGAPRWWDGARWWETPAPPPTIPESRPPSA